MENLSLTLYEKLLRIRYAENFIIQHYFDNDMKTPMHMSAGAEHIAVGVCQALAQQAQLFCSYRSHGVFLANSNNTDKFFAELYGRITGTAAGKAGSMHLASPQTGLLCASAIVASTLPPAVGCAYANKVQNNNKVTAVFFGDGAMDEGNFWESLNLACVKQLPLLFICEDNGLAVHTDSKTRQGYKNIDKIIQEFNCQVFSENTTDVELIYHLTNEAREVSLQKQQPVFLHLNYYRYLEHVGILEDFDAGYRDKNTYLEWQKRDPINLQRQKLLAQNSLEKDLIKLEADIQVEIINSVEKAKRAPFPRAEQLNYGVYSD